MSAVLETRIAEWRAQLRVPTAITAEEAEELEGHLRDEAAVLLAAGLDEDEAFLIAIRRLGAIDAISAEFARTNSARLWKQLVLAAPTTPDSRSALTGLWWALGIGLVAAASFQLLLGSVIGWPGATTGPGTPAAYGLLTLMPVAALTIWLLVRRRDEASGRRRVLLALTPILLLTIGLALGPLGPRIAGGEWFALVALHAPIAAWLSVGLADVGAAWRDVPRRMDFVRFTGELAIYFTLLALGGGVLFGLTSAIVAPLAPAALPWLAQVGLGSCAVVAVPVSAWLVTAKQSIIENLAPVLARIFLPLVALVCLGAAALYLVGGAQRGFDREFMIVLDVLLVLVLGLVLYNLSARGTRRATRFFDIAGLLAIFGALVLDTMLLLDLIDRVGDYGWTANRVAALGLNLLLVVVLAVAAALSALQLGGRTPIAALERWLMSTLPAYSIWAAVVVLVLPLVFGTG